VKFCIKTAQLTSFVTISQLGNWINNTKTNIFNKGKSPLLKTTLVNFGFELTPKKKSSANPEEQSKMEEDEEEGKQKEEPEEEAASEEQEQEDEEQQGEEYEETGLE